MRKTEPFRESDDMKRFRQTARGTRRKPGEMNKLEAKMADELRAKQLAGEIEWFAFEAITIKLADRTRYTPDFLVMLCDGQLECWEVKGHWEDDARVKIKVAASLFPFVFRAFKPRTKKDGGGWSVETFGGHE